MAPNKLPGSGTDWIINCSYRTVNGERVIFKKTRGSEYIIHGLFVNDMVHISYKLKKEFVHKYSKDLEITKGGLKKTLLGMEFEQSGKTIKLHLDKSGADA